jgi:hypothetical protein
MQGNASRTLQVPFPIAKAVAAQASIIDDAAANVYFETGDNSGAPADLSLDLSAAGVTLTRNAAGRYDAAGFSAVAANRGYIAIWYLTV